VQPVADRSRTRSSGTALRGAFLIEDLLAGDDSANLLLPRNAVVGFPA